jgi:hypothetical protein
MGGFVVLLNAVSRGSVTIQSADPADAPACDSALLRLPYDIFAMTQSFRDFLRFMENLGMKKIHRVDEVIWIRPVE